MNKIRALVADLRTDARCAELDGYPEYAAACRDMILIVFQNRHGMKFDRYGWPLCLLRIPEISQ